MKPRLDKRTWDHLWVEWIKPIIIAALLAFLIRSFIVQPFKIPSSSMYPTLKPGDRIFVNKFLYGAMIPFTEIRLPAVEHPKTGDIVVFLSPAEKKKYLVKRFIAGGGQEVQIKGGRIFVNGKELSGMPFEKFTYYDRGKYASDEKVIHVPEDNFFVLGDNSANSMDSRYWGFTPYKNMVGKAFIIHWPIRRIRLLRDGE